MKNQPVINALYEGDNLNGQILSPAVGIYTPGTAEGIFLPERAFIGSLRILNTFFRLVLPQNINGYVVFQDRNNFSFPVEYGQELFRINPREDPGAREPVKGMGKQQGSPGDILKGETGLVIKAFTNGIFYTKPAPDAEPFVKTGQKIEKGKALGLIEVMKTFNHIIFQGSDTSDSGIIKQIFVKDAEEVTEGQPLFLIK